jgi:lipopolysaccharide/colanic/teichoic acid biosynthesis glycosyltransferase
MIIVTSGWPAFFIQERVGLGGEPFRMWKLRTMRPLEPGREHQAAVPGDARVTKVGRVLRRTRIDELPQLRNVLKGDMSLIGPRPELVSFHNSYTDAHPKFAYRCLVRPGISGWAQVNAPPSATADEAALKLTYDLYYVKRQSMTLDLQIAFRTLWTVMRGAGVR